MESVRKKVLVWLLVVITAAAGLTGCGIQDEYDGHPMTRVSVILPHDADQYWAYIRKGIEEKKEEASKNNIDIKILRPQLNYNISQMTEILKKEIAAKVDFIVVQGTEDPEYVKTLLEAQKQGIHVICMDTDIKDFPEHLYIGTDNYKAGLLLGEKLVELTDGDAEVAVISGEEGYLNLQQRYEGVRKAAEGSGIRFEGIYYDHYDGLTVMKLFREMGDGVNAIVCVEGTGGLTLATMLRAEEKKYKCLIGFDAVEGVEAGVLDGVVVQDMEQIGRYIVEEIIRNVTEGSYSAEQIFTDIRWAAGDRGEGAE